jgi:molybdate transport system regulatory protein
MAKSKIDATLSLHSGERFLVGRERIKLLKAVAEHGSISKAAKAVGFSYKTAWDSVDAINNLLPSPAFVTKMGGSGGGGGAAVTDEGLRLIETFNKIEEKLTRLSRLISEAGLEGNEELLLFTFGARISTRNVFQTVIQKIKTGAVDVELSLYSATGAIIHAVVTNEAAKELELEPGKKVLALIKAYAITLSTPKKSESFDGNNLLGTVARITKAKDNCEIILDIGENKSLTAVASRDTTDKLAIKPGEKLIAHFDPKDVIIAAN